MCGRYSLALSNEEVYDALQYQLPRMFNQGRPRWERQQDHRANYNVAPRQRAPVIRRDGQSGQPMIEEMQWGLIPHWTKHPPTGAMNTINARSEALLYYEWQKKASSKVAHFTRLPLTPKHTNANPPLIFFAGLYDIVNYVSPVESRFQPSAEDKREPYPTGNPLPLATFTILTTDPAKDITWLHDRMPCVLRDSEEVERWLDLGEVKGWEDGKGGTGALLRGCPGLDSFPVNPEVGKIGLNSPTFIQPVSERSDGIKSFFMKQQPSPARVKAISETRPQLEEKKPISELGGKVSEIVTHITKDDEEKGLGDDSNAPNPGPSKEEKPSLKSEEGKPNLGSKELKPESRAEEEPATQLKAEERQETMEEALAQPAGKRRRRLSDEAGVKEVQEEPKKRGGHQTKVVRRPEAEDGKKDQTAITNFFKSPGKEAAATAGTRKTPGRKVKR